MKQLLAWQLEGGDAQCVSSGFNYRVDIPETLTFIDSVIAGLE